MRRAPRCGASGAGYPACVPTGRSCVCLQSLCATSRRRWATSRAPRGPSRATVSRRPPPARRHGGSVRSTQRAPAVATPSCRRNALLCNTLLPSQRPPVVATHPAMRRTHPQGRVIAPPYIPHALPGAVVAQRPFGAAPQLNRVSDRARPSAALAAKSLTSVHIPLNLCNRYPCLETLLPVSQLPRHRPPAPPPPPVAARRSRTDCLRRLGPTALDVAFPLRPTDPCRIPT
jgi:hypothetical protein